MEVFDWQAFHFLRPFALLGVVPAVLIAIWYAVRQTGRERFASLLSPELQGVLVTGSDGGRRWLVAGMIAAMLGLGAITIAGPTWQRQDVPARDLDDALVVLFDLSLSMHAEDITPSRLHRARRELADLLTLREEGTTALIAYAGDAHVVTPLTDDVDTIRHMSDSLTPEIMPILGSRTPVAIELANQLLENGAEEKGRILLITDGIRGLEASASACDTRYPLSILGVGTAARAPVPVPVGEGRTQWLADSNGNRVTAQLDSPRLRELAGFCGGAYSEVRVGDEDLLTILPGLGDASDEFDTRDDVQQVDMWIDMAYAFAIPLALLMLLAFRRGALPVILLASVCVPLLGAPNSASASFWDDVWQRRDQQAYEALQAQDAEAASTLFEDERWRGVADFSRGAFGEAASTFGELADKQANDYYNLGNSLAFSGDVPGAIDAYEQALAVDPAHEDAVHNKTVLEALMSEQQQNQSDQSGERQEGQPDANEGQPPQDNGNQSDAHSNTDQSQAQGEQSSEQQDAQSSEPSEASQQEAQASESQSVETSQSEAQPTENGEPEIDAAAQAARARERINSLLRRVPDDPGGLLRQKFLFETREREQAGKPRVDSEQPW